LNTHIIVAQYLSILDCDKTVQKTNTNAVNQKLIYKSSY